MAIPDQYDAFGEPQWIIEREERDPIVLSVWSCSTGVRTTIDGGHGSRLVVSIAELHALIAKLDEVAAEADALERQVNR